jgi:hypothetical protein
MEYAAGRFGKGHSPLFIAVTLRDRETICNEGMKNQAEMDHC